ncbi:MAG: chemotaxis protein CheW [Pseudomonadales bacterium]|nr:chemotaxis protein CheW [Pseudomonadales bacterium]
MNSVESVENEANGLLQQGEHGVDQYLTFVMEDDEYGVDILCVQEIRGWEDTTPIPNAPGFVKGVINLRGTIVPIIDIRQCFNMQETTYGSLTVVIVLRANHEAGSRTIGIVVDAVSDVHSFSESDLHSPPSLGNSVNTSYIKGLAQAGQNMVILLDIDRALNFDELQGFMDVQPEADAAPSNS